MAMRKKDQATSYIVNELDIRNMKSESLCIN